MAIVIGIKPRHYGFARAYSEFTWEPEEGLLAVRRFDNHADPTFCVCGHGETHHGQLYDRVGPPGEKVECRYDCQGAGTNVCTCMRYQYDFDNPSNQYKRDFYGYCDYPT